MTGCLLISPGGIPAILADTMVTNPRVRRDNLLLPSNVTAVNARRMDSVNLARKVYIINNLCAVAFSGDSATIEDFLTSIRPLVKAWQKDEKPMRYLYSMSKDYPKIQVIGATLTPGSLIDNKINNKLSITAPIVSLFHNTFGYTAAIGSGSDALNSRLQHLNRQLINLQNPLDPFEIIRQTLSVEPASRLRAEIMGEDSSDWGGYLEYVLYDLNTNKFHYGPRRLNLFFHAIPTDIDTYIFRIHDRAICYDPGDEIGRVLTIDGDDTSPYAHEFLLRNILFENHSNQNIIAGEFWSKWFPEITTVALMIHQRNGVIRSLYSDIYNDLNVDKVRFSLTSKGFTFGLSDDIALRTLGTLLQSVGLKAAD